MEFFFDELVINGRHQTTGRLAVVPINGNGDITMRMKNVTMIASARIERINGNFLNLDNFVVAMRVEDASARFTGFGPLDDTVSNVVSASLVAIINAGDGSLIANIFQRTINLFVNQIRIIDIINAILGRSSDIINHIEEIESPEMALNCT